MLLLLRLISATLVAATLADDARRHHGRRFYRKKRRMLLVADEDFFFDGGSAPIIMNEKRNVPAVRVLNPKRASPNVVSSSLKAPESGNKVIECDPRADDTQPDVGILACAKGSQCVQSDESALGGVCTFLTQQRMLDESSYGFAEYCANNSGQGADSTFESCDCSHLVNGIGPVSCTIYSRYCFDVAENYCTAFSYEGEVRFENDDFSYRHA